MIKNQYKTPVLFFLLAALVILTIQLTGCSGAVQLKSDWKNSVIVIDGKQDDWAGYLYDFKKNDLTVGICNDDENIYICFISYDQGVRRQIMDGGFTVWFDPGGGTEELYGIKYPAGRPRGERTGDMSNDNRQLRKSENTSSDFSTDELGNTENMPPSPILGSDNDGKMPSISGNAQFEMQFLGPNENEVREANILELKSAAIKVSLTQKTFVYELKVPLHRTSDFPFTIIPTNRENIIGIGFKTEENSISGFSKSPKGPGGGRPGGGAPPGGGPPGSVSPGGGPPSGGYGDMRRGGGSDSSKPVELCIKAVLSGNLKVFEKKK
ncbi:MAG: hypothetical protein JXA06_12880 [Bacteroidetes bacterium]|nr:hypothetical protein [Bacteroidota bacterium]